MPEEKARNILRAFLFFLNVLVDHLQPALAFG
jgi:hypothetical protein